MATLTRDQILGRALDMVGSPALNNNDRPAGTIVASAVSISWLQDALNLLADEFPWAQNVSFATAPVQVVGAWSIIALPTDFILDVRDGVYLSGASTSEPRPRLRRLAFQKMITQLTAQPGLGTPRRYTVFPGNMAAGGIVVWPQQDKAYTANMWYYARPAALTAGDIPTFPSDLPLVEYVRYRGLEWIRSVKEGAALAYLQSQITDLRKSDLGFEPESDTIPFDSDQFIPMGDMNQSNWMGSFS